MGAVCVWFSYAGLQVSSASCRLLGLQAYQLLHKVQSKSFRSRLQLGRSEASRVRRESPILMAHMSYWFWSTPTHQAADLPLAQSSGYLAAQTCLALGRGALSSRKPKKKKPTAHNLESFVMCRSLRRWLLPPPKLIFHS